MTFYTAVGSYQMRTENGREMPYILRMGRMEPISIPEFFIWSHLLWEVETYDEIREFYQNQSKSLGVRLPNLDQALKMLIKRKLIAKGIWAGEAWSNPDGLVFTDAAGGHLVHLTVYKEFKNIARSLGYENTRFHDLRHSYAVAAIESGDDIKTVQTNLGHATASFTLDIYGHASQKMRQQSADRMERYIKSVISN